MHVWIEFERSVPERSQHLHAVICVPDTCADHASRTHDPMQFGACSLGITHEVKDQLGGGNIEVGIGKRNGLSPTLMDVDAGVASGALSDETGRGVAG